MRTLILCLLFVLPAAAGEKPIAYPIPAEYRSPNGLYVFALIPPLSDDPQLADTAPQAEVRRKYPTSGAYRINDPKNPLWTVDWYDYEAFIADDGEHLVRIHGENTQWRHYSGRTLPEDVVAEQLAAPGISFYKNGELLRTYSVRELVARPEDLPHTMRYILWNAGGVFSKDGQQFVLMTQDSRQMFFDLETGKMTDSRDAGLGNAKVWVIRVSLALVGTAVVVVMGIYLYHLRKA